MLEGLLEFSGELEVSIGPHDSAWKWHPSLVVVEAQRSGGNGCTYVSLQNVPARDAIARLKVLPNRAGERAECRGD